MVESKGTDQYALILKKFIAGDENALSVIYFDFFDLLLNFGLKYTVDQSLVEDCIQNIFVDLLKNRKKLEFVENISFYLLKSLRYQINHEQTRIRKIISDETFREPPFLITYSAEKDVILQETDDYRKKILSILLEKLTPKQREVLYLKYNCGFNYEQISDLLQVDIPSVRKMVYRTLKSIRENSGTTNPDMLLFCIVQPSFMFV